MSKTKSASKKQATKTVLQKISATAAHLKDEIVSGKDHLVEVAGDAIESIKASVHKITHTGKQIKKTKALPKRAIKRSAKKVIKRVAVKKLVPAKKFKKAVKKNKL